MGVERTFPREDKERRRTPGCTWLPPAAAGCRAPAANGKRGLRGGGGRGGRRHTRCSPPPPRRGEAQRWRAERIGALCHSVAGRAAATKSGAEEDEAGAAWKWNIDGGELFEECLRRAKLEGHLPDLMRGCPFSGQTALTRSMLRALTLPYVTRALNGDFPGSDLKAAEEA